VVNANRIFNPGFEDRQENRNGWGFWLDGSGGLEIDKITYPSVTMKYFSPSDSWTGFNTADISVGGGKTYKFGMDYVETAGFSQKACVLVREYNNAGQQETSYYLTTSLPHSTTWSRWEQNLTTQAATVKLTIHIYPIGTGSAWYDNFALIEQ